MFRVTEWRKDHKTRSSKSLKEGKKKGITRLLPPLDGCYTTTTTITSTAQFSSKVQTGKKRGSKVKEEKK